MRHSARPLLLSAAIAAAAFGTPAIAQSGDSYEYAQPAPDAGVVYESREVVQRAPAATPTDQHVEVIERVAAPPPPAPPLPPVPPMPPMAHHPLPPPVTYAPPPPPPYVEGAYPAPYPPQAYAPAGFDRDRWLADCHDRIRGVDARDRGGVIGGLLGAIGGGVIGNRAWDRHRTAGTLLGAGVGGLAGLAVGSPIGAAGERRHDDDCAYYLDEYTTGYPGFATYQCYGAYPGYGYGYSSYALVPVLIAVPQRQVIRETVTEEWVDEPVRTRSIPPRRHHAAPAPAPRTKYIKGS
jgi:hypothetical protein